MSDLLDALDWRCASLPAGAAADPSALPAAEPRWLPADVPGTAAGALRSAGRWSWGEEDRDRLDGRDWWFLAPLPASDSGPFELRLDGLATLADVWLDGAHVAHSENMFVPLNVEVPGWRLGAELAIRCAALDARLAERHPRPRFKSRLPRHQALRWYRTTLLGRMPGWSRWAAPVGPWRPVTLVRVPDVGSIHDVRITSRCLPGGDGEVRVRFTLHGARVPPAEAVLEVEGEAAPLMLQARTPGESGDATVDGVIRIPQIERWWPHTHGPQPLYEVSVKLGGRRFPLRRVGFRDVELDRRGGAFRLIVNGRPIFCRGVTWGPVDAVSLNAPWPVRAADLQRAREAGLNLIRLGGYGLYEDPAFWDHCDELGLMVWQDVMIAAVDPPEDPAFARELARELDAQFGGLGGRPALVMTCGSSETYQQGAMLGLAPDRYRSTLLEEQVPAQLSRLVPEVPYVPSSPSGGDPPIRTDEGVCHYFGVGAYLRPPEDARLADVRFAAECLSFSNPPGRDLVDREFGSAAAAGHDARWKLAVARDAGTSWDFEDVRDHYVQELFGVDPLLTRYRDPEFALDLGRAAVVELVGRAFADWRGPDTRCAGAIMLAWRDLWPGAGWGVLDAMGSPKAAFHALARVSAPRAVLLRDRGLNGLAIDLHNDPPRPLSAVLEVVCFDARGRRGECATRSVEIPPAAHLTLDAATVLGGFRDLTGAYRFSPAVPDAVQATISDEAGTVISRAVYLPNGPARERLADAGIRARTCASGPGDWTLELTSERLATFVSLEVPGFTPADAWFHLPPGERVLVALRGDGTAAPTGVARALNVREAVRIETAGT